MICCGYSTVPYIEDFVAKFFLRMYTKSSYHVHLRTNEYPSSLHSGWRYIFEMVQRSEEIRYTCEYEPKKIIVHTGPLHLRVSNIFFVLIFFPISAY